jgi:UDP-N-acetylglucosamine 2-epimerase (non-hydrolysing)
MDEVLSHYMQKIQASDVLERMSLKSGKFFIVSAHREENVDTPDNLRDLMETLNSLANTYD